MRLWKQFKYSRQDLFIRYQRVLESQKGFQPLADGETGQRYLGSPNKFYTRFRQTYRNLMSWGITMEKDAGEQFFKGSNPYGFDFYSAHFYLNNVHKHVQSIALGDFQAFFGQGLTMWGGFGARKGAVVTDIKGSLQPFEHIPLLMKPLL